MALRVFNPLFNLKAFEGPLDLLVHLIENKELDIYEVVVYEVMHQYQSYLKTLQDYDLDVAGEFLSIVSSLMLLKSKMLLPKHDEKESLDESTLRYEILDQLLHYYKFKDLAMQLCEQEKNQAARFNRGLALKSDQLSEPPLLKPSSTSILYDLFLEIMRKNALKKKGEIEEENYRVSDMIRFWKSALKETPTLYFDQIFDSKEPKLKLITLFLALLELLKNGWAKVLLQNETLEIQRVYE